MELKKVTQEMRDKLRAPLPPESISQHPTKTYLSSIKAIYVEERLNDVFGIGAWSTKVEHMISEKAQKADKNGFFPIMVVCKLTFEIPEYGIYHECFGGNDNADLGDAYKGATTDAITKVGSYLEIGIDVYKGKGSKPSYASKFTPKQPPIAERPVLRSITPLRSELKPGAIMGEKYECGGCSAKITKTEADYSVKNFGIALCRKCQAKNRKISQ